MNITIPPTAMYYTPDDEGEYYRFYRVRSVSGRSVLEYYDFSISTWVLANNTALEDFKARRISIDISL